MKKIFNLPANVMICLLLLSGILSCKKEEPFERTDCYECRFPGGAPIHKEVGCYTKSKWDQVKFKDGYGNYLNKALYCRTKQ